MEPRSLPEGKAETRLARLEAPHGQAGRHPATRNQPQEERANAVRQRDRQGRRHRRHRGPRQRRNAEVGRRHQRSTGHPGSSEARAQPPPARNGARIPERGAETSVRPPRHQVLPGTGGENEHHVFGVRTLRSREPEEPSGLSLRRVSAHSQRRRERRRKHAAGGAGALRGRGGPIPGSTDSRRVPVMGRGYDGEWTRGGASRTQARRPIRRRSAAARVTPRKPQAEAGYASSSTQQMAFPQERTMTAERHAAAVAAGERILLIVTRRPGRQSGRQVPVSAARDRRSPRRGRGNRGHDRPGATRRRHPYGRRRAEDRTLVAEPLAHARIAGALPRPRGRRLPGRGGFRRRNRRTGSEAPKPSWYGKR